ncbi:MAG: radical SAM protein [Candidatus Riflebacteria bacterium]|nr:radical SAM protein [Candidatus Riflebacteria bacterium]
MIEDDPLTEVERGPLRPPSEARSLLIRVVRNCPWNRCAFCPAYKGEKFLVRPINEVLNDIRHLALNPDTHLAKTAFLQDADALIAPTDTLLRILQTIKQTLPGIERITTYTRSNTLSHLPTEALKSLREAGLSRIHVGIESHCDEVLKMIQKGTTPQKQIEGCLHAKEAGLELCCYVMPGVGGKRFSEQNAIETGRFVAKIEPNHVRLRTCFVLEDTPLANDFNKGLFEPLSEEETVREIRLFLTQLAHAKTELICDHRINLLLELRGSLPEQYDQLIGIIDRFLALSAESKKQFIAGRRMGLIRRIDELFDPDKKSQLEEAALNYKAIVPIPKGVLY